LVERFLREARSATRIKSEHVVRVMDVGRLEDGLPFLVMEYLEGCDLGELLCRHGAMEVTDAVEAVLHACEALAIAHAQGIIHRDIKPANLFRTSRPDGTPLIKLVDFGISKAALTGRLGEDVSLTHSQSVVGSPLYMSPEAMESARRIDARSDIWSLGVVLYELLSGELAFSGESITRVCIAVLQEEPRSLREIKPQIADGLEQVVLRCLAKNPEERYQTVADLAEALLPFGPARASVLVDRARAVVSGAKVGDSDSRVPWDPAVSTLAASRRSRSEQATLGAQGSSLAPGSPLPFTPSREAKSRPEERRIAGPGEATAVSAPPTERLVTPSPLHRRKVAWRLPALALLAVTMGVAAYVAARVSAPAKTPPPASVATMDSSVPTHTLGFTLHIESDPPGATVHDGDLNLGATPVQMVLDPKTVEREPKRLVVHKDGYLPHTVVQGPSDADVRQVISLHRAPDAAIATAMAPPEVPAPARTVLPPKGPKPAPAPSRTTPVIRVER
jgi:serine/threonine-protein kinase